MWNETKLENLRQKEKEKITKREKSPMMLVVFWNTPQCVCVCECMCLNMSISVNVSVTVSVRISMIFSVRETTL